MYRWVDPKGLRVVWIFLLTAAWQGAVEAGDEAGDEASFWFEVSGERTASITLTEMMARLPQHRVEYTDPLP
jgi:hypothetical protein